jgi:8-oxo-dGTP diphosphatase
VARPGYFLKEFRLALQLYSQQPKNSIILIPIKFDACKIPKIRHVEVCLADFQWIDWRRDGLNRLIDVLNTCAPIMRNRSTVWLTRQEIGWDQFNKKVSNRFWACGTSLMGVAERKLGLAHRKLVPEFFARGLKDIRILLPDTRASLPSTLQLKEYNKAADGPVVSQLHAAKESYKVLKSQISKLAAGRESDYLRTYKGIMYSNITIYDDDAFISFYDSTGLGDNNISLHFNRQGNEEGYERVAKDFERMWSGEAIVQKMGTSMIFLDSGNNILLYLRDNKQTIPFPNRWDLLGGHVKEGESPEHCIIRELDEEIEYQLRDPKLFATYDMDDRTEFMFWQSADQQLENFRLHEGQMWKWFSEEEIKAMDSDEFAFGFRRLILDFYRKIKPGTAAENHPP